MNTLILSPYKIKNFCYPSSPLDHEDNIFIGVNQDGLIYRVQLFFNTSLFNFEETIKHAILKMFCNSENTTVSLIAAYISGTCICQHVQTAVKEKGWYEWDLTKMMYILNEQNPMKVCLFTICHTPSKLKSFCFENTCNPISLKITTYPLEESNSSLQKESVLSQTSWQQSRWIKCADYKNYVYHIYNSGNTEVEVVINISPNKICYTTSSPIYKLKPTELVVIEPLNYSRYICIRFRNICEPCFNPIELWFQALQ